MKIAVLSGKGGTGKTLVSTNLAAIAPRAVYVDCDVEEPNGHLFFKPDKLSGEDIYVQVPSVKQEICNGCRECVEFCRFNALAYVNDRLLIFSEMCHSCGGCIKLCPPQALFRKSKAIGRAEKGISDNTTVVTGVLNIGEASGVPIIKRLIQNDYSPADELVIIDCPPGSACSVMESIKDADYCVLVTEPTILGVHNFKMVLELTSLFAKPYGVVLNKWVQDNEDPAEEFCRRNNINVLAKIPFDSELGYLNSRGMIAVQENELYRGIFSQLLKAIISQEVHHETTVNS